MPRRSRKKEITNAWTGKTYVVGLTPQLPEHTPEAPHNNNFHGFPEGLTRSSASRHSHQSIDAVDIIPSYWKGKLSGMDDFHVAPKAAPMPHINNKLTSTNSPSAAQILQPSSAHKEPSSEGLDQLALSESPSMMHVEEVSTQSKSLTEFSLFRMLPPELKLEIWEAAVNMVPGRDLKAITREGMSELLYELGEHWLPAVGLRGACYDSRRFWTKRWGNPCTDMFPFDPTTDSVLITRIDSDASDEATEGYFDAFHLAYHQAKNQRFESMLQNPNMLMSMSADLKAQFDAFVAKRRNLQNDLRGTKAVSRTFKTFVFDATPANAVLFRAHMGDFTTLGDNVAKGKTTMGLWQKCLPSKVTKISTDHRAVSIRWICDELIHHQLEWSEGSRKIPLSQTLHVVDIPIEILTTALKSDELEGYDPKEHMQSLVAYYRWGYYAKRVCLHVDKHMPKTWEDWEIAPLMMSAFADFEVQLSDGRSKMVYPRYQWSDEWRAMELAGTWSEDEKREEEEAVRNGHMVESHVYRAFEQL